MKRKYRSKLTMPLKYPPPLYVVEWEDAFFHDFGLARRQTIAEMNPVVVWSVGYLFEDSERRVILCGSVAENFEDPGFSDALYIPRGMVRTMTKIKA
jgi:hypothetical protein